MSETRLLRVGPDPGADEGVREGARLIRAGEVVAFPTETVYGLGADATSETAVEKIYVAKRRPRDNPSIVHIADADDLARVARASDEARTLAASFWPGPLTLVLPVAGEVASAVSHGLGTVGVRMPSHPIALALIALSGRPVAAPSANLSGRPSPTTAAHVLEDLGGRIPLILDGGPCAVGVESTVLDLTGEEPAILRPGGVAGEDIEAALGRPVLAGGDEVARRRSPGTRYRHYRPAAPVVIVREGTETGALVAWAAEVAAEGGGVGIGYLGWREGVGALPSVRFRRVPAGDASALGAALYDAFREFDAAGARYILCDEPPPAGLGIAVRERLRRAASFEFAGGAPRPV
jgi:L-threonylcarbamoyladenylate synthase